MRMIRFLFPCFCQDTLLQNCDCAAFELFSLPNIYESTFGIGEPCVTLQARVASSPDTTLTCGEARLMWINIKIKNTNHEIGSRNNRKLDKKNRVWRDKVKILMISNHQCLFCFHDRPDPNLDRVLDENVFSGRNLQCGAAAWFWKYLKIFLKFWWKHLLHQKPATRCKSLVVEISKKNLKICWA